MNDPLVIAGIVNGVNQVLNAVIRQLDTKGIISKDRLAEEIEAAVAGADATRPADQPLVDFALMRNLAKLLRDPRAAVWTPTVIEGGLSPDKDDENSH